MRRHGGLRALVVGGLLLLGLVNWAGGNEYYVAMGGNNTASGDISHPWNDLAVATPRLHPGDTLYVQPGNYGAILMYPENSGTAEAPIRIQALGQVNITRNGQFGDGIDLEGASYITIDGFNCSGRARAGIRSVTNTGVVIRNCVTDSNTVWGIFTGHSENMLIENNVCSRSVEQHGIYFSNSADNPVIRNNVCWGNYDCGIQINADVSMGGDGITTNALIENNILYNNGAGGGSAINLDGAQSSIVRNNLLYDNTAGGIVMYKGNGAAGPQNNLVENNTIIMPSGSRWAVNVGNAVGPNTLRNNIIYSTGNSGSIQLDSVSKAGFISDYNIESNKFFDGSNTLTKAAWTTSTGQDANSVIVSSASIPNVFVNFSGKDFHLRPGSLAIDMGASLGSPNDLQGRLRPIDGRYDVGCYEYTLAGDINCDGKVSFSDYLTLEQGFGKSGKTWAQGDLNGDGKVSFSDYLLLEQSFGQSIPEPASLSLLVVGGLTLLKRRRSA